MKNRSFSRSWLFSVVLLFLFLQTAYAVTWQPLPDTGQDQCYDHAGVILDPCPLPEYTFYGQDANYWGDAQPDYQDNGDGTVTDLVTGLMWFQADDGERSNWNDADLHCDDSQLAGYSDWRLPSIFELASLYYAGTDAPLNYIHPVFQMTSAHGVSQTYWSSTPLHDDFAFHWVKVFSNDEPPDLIVDSNEIAYRRCVRGTETIQNHFSLSGSGGSVLDEVTRLQWQRDDSSLTYAWPYALRYCDTLDHDGYSDWRLPNVRELLSIVDYSTGAPAIDPLFSGEMSQYWTSTTKQARVEQAQVVDFAFGHAYGVNKSYTVGSARCVRNGLKQHTINVMQSGSGSGTIVSDSGEVNCSLDLCSYVFPKGMNMILTATPDTGSAFSRWGGTFNGHVDCDGDSGTCSIWVQDDAYIVAYFQTPKTLTVTKEANNVIEGKVVSTPTGIDCDGVFPDDCEETYNYGANVALTALFADNVIFDGWSGACTGAEETCVVTMDADKSVHATFLYSATISGWPLHITKSGTGVGRITSSPGGIDCGDNCSKSFDGGTSVTLTALASTGSDFTQWSGDISGTPCAANPTATTCTVTMNQIRNVDAEFTVDERVLQPLVVRITDSPFGNTGTVTSNPAGISCEQDCIEEFPWNTQVTLTASPEAGSGFLSWSGDTTCGTDPQCTVYTDHYRGIRAEFGVAPIQTNVMLSVEKAGNGVGIVASVPAGIDCGNDCGETLSTGTEVTLTATPAGGTDFTGWSGGGCTGVGDCVITPATDTTVTATFEVDPTAQQELTVTRIGSGAVMSVPAGIDCGTSCGASYDYGASVVLDALADVGNTFLGWSSTSGECMSDPFDCLLVMELAKSIRAEFEPDYAGDALCVGDTPLIEQHQFPAGNNFRCEAAISITLQNDVTAKDHSQVEVIAPEVKVNGPFSIQGGALYRANQP